MDWRDYALKTENEKVSKLEAEVKRLTIKSESLDSRVRDFEKEMIKKDHELEKAQAQLTNKSALQGVAEQAMNNPQAMTILSGLASRILGLPDPQQPQLQQGALQGTGNAETDEFLANIGKWMVGQPIELQHQFYALIVELTKTKEGDPTAVSSRIINIINFLKNGTVLKRTA